MIYNTLFVFLQSPKWYTFEWHFGVPVIDVVVRQAQELHVEVVHPRGFVYVFEGDHLIALFQGAKVHKFRTYRFFYNYIQKFMLYPMLKIPCVPKPISTMTC